MTGAPHPSSWPERPRPGALVRLSLPLPPMLLDAVGYEGSVRYVALWWTPLGDELMWSDGTATAIGGFHAWLCLTRHPLGRVILGPYRLGDSETEAQERLLADRWQHTLHIGLARDVEQLLATQPSELAALLDGLGADKRDRALTRALDAIHPPSLGDVMGRLRREAQLVGQLGSWLDELAERLHDQVEGATAAEPARGGGHQRPAAAPGAPVLARLARQARLARRCRG